MSWERDFNNNRQKREDRRKQKDKKKKHWDDEAEHIKHCCRNPQKTRQELKMDLYEEEDIDGF